MSEEIVNVNGIDMYAHQDMVVRAARNNGWVFEQDSFNKWLEFCSGGGWVLDIGAYTGIYSIAARNCGAHPLAFEPNPYAYDRLLKNVDLNGVSVDCSSLALGRVIGTRKFALKPSTPITSAGRVIDPDDDQKDSIAVRLGCLDDLFPNDNFAAMKIDVEGYELDVLMGGSFMISRCRPCIIVECLDEDSKKSVIDFLSRFNYPEPTIMDGRNLVFDTRG